MDAVSSGFKFGEKLFEFLTILAKKSPDFPQRKAEELIELKENYFILKLKIKEMARGEFFSDVLAGLLNDLLETEQRIDSFLEEALILYNGVNKND